ncbi:type II CAAX endopeptidase family protein [Isobaculum melis]|uniref:CAAX prenyl protease 2/Lysostaphin resistance protein A-like domain-containing protein n=1 Tax=Isobaculum melis TaxID=142588 RepID=A0A1H9U6P5_9LACT|nr:type II CAAX endopeptidase family protein [Isobaculum melis]SES04817.1 hypothetical protein SAMN04488559_1229 [Isobaculum melis]
METTLTIQKKQGYALIFSAICIGIIYQLLPHLTSNASLLQIVGTFFNAVLMGIFIYFILKKEFWEWFKHFSFKWTLIGIPLLLIVGTIAGILWNAVAGGRVENSVDAVLSWSYILENIPFMLLGEELLCISILYGAWKKLNLPFWQATLICSILFAVWHLPAYGFNLLQCLVTIIPSRLVLNGLFKKTNSIWVTFIVHLAFDIFSFLPILLK